MSAAAATTTAAAELLLRAHSMFVGFNSLVEEAEIASVIIIFINECCNVVHYSRSRWLQDIHPTTTTTTTST